MSVLRGHELYRFFHVGDDETPALRGIDVQLDAGEMVALVGPSGSGKSTLLACLAGLDEPDGGHVDVMGERLSRRPEATRARLRARHIGMLMQSNNLFDHLTVSSNIALQIELSGKGEQGSLLQRLGIGEHGDAMPSQLSGGEAARAGLAVALAADPDILICDEPTAEVDADTEHRILEFLDERRRAGCAILVATHSASLAQCADRILRIKDGRIVHD
ncbi:ABC transporter ATP-binding protein [Afipia sp. Root123D2]|mgnify:CR=1 FL=1|jgi:putative ABC transport system ATP-binding protein|uniref:ABC transporter ATP-binding protein n=1 Tax=Nitrobacteraceae TaxID=41294 RepID=UPI0006F2D528|nr:MULTISPECIES: ABC transporter ATP-binding protein [Nitrobacteraceae]KQW18184.1 ABC transporter ATP-binding protein [Afipia sp. Root123D2]MBN9149687.1 ABC transporter ATP-binding protein [Nitrobacter sp.]OJV00348.1 MAG: ABC transporter ATP-binding protein [Nitrobacter sp. 62-23]